MVPSKAADGPLEPTLDVSWIRVYLVIRGTSQGISTADIVVDLARFGFTYSPRTIARIMKGLETKGYIAQTRARNGSKRIFYRATVKGRAVSKALRRHLREFFKCTSSVEASIASPRR